MKTYSIKFNVLHEIDEYTDALLIGALSDCLYKCANIIGFDEKNEFNKEAGKCAHKIRIKAFKLFKPVEDKL